MANLSPTLPTTPFDHPIRLGVLISGGGTTLVNFVKQIQGGTLPGQVVQVIASRGNCGGIARSQAAGLPCEVIVPKAFPDVRSYSEAVFAKLRDAGVELVTLAGFLSLLHIPDDFLGRVMNIHPALIPAFCGPGYYGHHVHEAVLARGAKISGCTVHFADNQYDHGPIILQRSVPVLDQDTPDSLAARVFEAECEAYPEAIRLYAQGKLTLDKHHVRIRA